MKSIFTLNIRLASLLVLLLMFGKEKAHAQFPASSYGYAAASGTYTDIAGTPGLTVIPNAFYGDDNITANLPIGFTFNYCGLTYTQVKACTNGWLTFNTPSSNYWVNDYANLSSYSINPVLMALWDDLNGTGGNASYVTTGTAPNRKFTFQFKNWQWYTGYNNTISFQVSLYETTNVIEYQYKQESGALGGFSESATIGIADGGALPTYLSLNNSTATATASSTSFVTNINTKPVNGQIYRFTPPVNCSTATGMPTAGTVIANPANLCLTGNVTLNFTPATPMPPVTGITYKWQSSPTAGGTYTDIPGAVTSAPTYTTTTPITANTYYKCVMLCNTSTTVLTSSASNLVAVNNPVSPTGVAGARCGPGSVALSATAPAGSSFRWYDAATGGAPLFTGASFNTPYTTNTRNFYVTSSTGVTPVTVAVGAGALVPSYQYVTIFAGSWGGYKHQYLIRESEMIAAGILPGYPINSISVDNANGSGTYNGFSLSLKSTPVTELTTTFETGATQVLGPVNYSTVVGNNTFTLTVPYTYTGGSLLIETCWSNATGSNPYSNIRYDNTSFPSTHYAYQDYQTPAVICAGPSNNGTPENTRPQFKFNIDAPCQSPRVAVQATINTSPVVAKTAPAVVCNDNVAAITLTPPTPAYPGYTWTPVTNLYTDPGTTTPYTGGSATSVYMRTGNVGVQTYYMMAGNPLATTGCTFADTVKIWVQPGHVSIKGMPDTICVSGTTKLSLDTVAGYYAGSIQWQKSTDNITYADISGATSPVYVTPTLNYGENTYFKAIIKAGTAICQSPVKYVVIANPSLISVPDTFNCGPGPVTLKATTGGNGSAVWYENASGGFAVGSGSPFVTPPLTATKTYYVSAGGGGSSGVIAVGAGASTSGNAVTPFYGVYGGYKHQYLIRASELVAAGIPAGKIISVGLDVVTAGTTFQGFQVSIGTTTANALNTTWQPNLAVVRLPASLTTTAGINTITFNNPFTWDGSSNIVIQTCWSNNNGSNTTNTVKYDEISYAATAYRQIDNTTAAAVCGQTTTTSTLSQRPKFIIGYDNRCESPRQAVIAHIYPKPSVDLGPDIDKCVDAGAAEVLDAGVQPNTPHFLWDNGDSIQVRAVTQSGTYSVRVTNQYTCYDDDSVVVLFRRNPVVRLGNDTTVCNGVVLPLNAGSDGIDYFWSNGQTTQVINVNAAGSYNVFVTNNLGCVKTDTIVVNMAGELPTVQGINVSNNGINTFHFTAVNPQNVIGYDWDFGDSTAHSYQAAPTHTYANAGNYIVTLKLSSSCGFLTDSSSAHIVGIHQLNVGNDELTVYPNPAKGTATILNKGALKMESVSVYNILGQVVYKATADSNDKHTLQLNGLASGVYTIQVFTDKGTVARKLELVR